MVHLRHSAALVALTLPFGAALGIAAYRVTEGTTGVEVAAAGLAPTDERRRATNGPPRPPVGFAQVAVVPPPSPQRVAALPLASSPNAPPDEEAPDPKISEAKARVQANIRAYMKHQMDRHRSLNDERYHFWYMDPPEEVLRVEGAIKDWFATFPEDEKPNMAAVSFAFNDLLCSIPVVPTENEAVWIAERARLADWERWGDPPEVALIRYLGEERIKRACNEEQLEELYVQYAEFGVLRPPGYQPGDEYK